MSFQSHGPSPNTAQRAGAGEWTTAWVQANSHIWADARQGPTPMEQELPPNLGIGAGVSHGAGVGAQGAADRAGWATREGPGVAGRRNNSMGVEFGAARAEQEVLQQQQQQHARPESVLEADRAAAVAALQALGAQLGAAPQASGSPSRAEAFSKQAPAATASQSPRTPGSRREHGARPVAASSLHGAAGNASGGAANGPPSVSTYSSQYSLKAVPSCVEGGSATKGDIPDFGAWPLRQLKEFLAAHSCSIVGASEKGDLVKLCQAAYMRAHAGQSPGAPIRKGERGANGATGPAVPAAAAAAADVHGVAGAASGVPGGDFAGATSSCPREAQAAPPVVPPPSKSAQSDAPGDGDEATGVPDFGTWPMRQLKEFLAARNCSMVGASEKGDLVKLCRIAYMRKLPVGKDGAHSMKAHDVTQL